MKLFAGLLALPLLINFNPFANPTIRPVCPDTPDILEQMQLLSSWACPAHAKESARELCEEYRAPNGERYLALVTLPSQTCTLIVRYNSDKSFTVVWNVKDGSC